MLSWLFILVAILVVLALAAVPLRRHRQFLKQFADSPHIWPDKDEETVVQEVHTEDEPAPGLCSVGDEEKQCFRCIWGSVQERLDREPKKALIYADLLVSDIMQAYGFPVHETDNGAELFLDGRLKEKYRTAHQTAIRTRRGDVKEDQLRKAMACFGAVLDELVADRTPSTGLALSGERSRRGEMHDHHWA